MTKQRVIVAMSGGVDSAVAAGLLLRQGYDVVGVTMRLWTHDEPLAPRYQRRCCAVEDIDDARAAADALGIPHYVLNMEEQFGARVVDYFVDEYRRGRTPNPCLPCNEHVKFGALLGRIDAFEADYLATGHYARIDKRDGGHRLLRALDAEKDQSYVLYMLTQSDLSRLLFPIGDLHKDETRRLAREMGLLNADKLDSADICFLPTEDYREFISQRVPQTAGDIVDSAGAVVGRHEGVAGFTIGQRRGLGVALGEKRYVTEIDPELNVITIGSDDDLLSDALTAETMRWVSGEPPPDDFEADVKIRYRADAQPATIRITTSGAEVRFREPQRALTPGQAVVCYRSDELLGGGIIAATQRLTNFSITG
ncbi:MAG: tRNA 2-thiouridine(34) synthase MnmA [Dehalococcoidia bacterium]